ncbi:MAG: type II toxin-antitoxin system VapC family toxin [Ignavibacteria bacterium]|nr:type II toxin-antitoxin system VapC family toxin [Ignavibacteria bacterium]
MKHSVLLDTSFFVRLLNDEDSLHNNAKGYFRYFLENEIVLKVSTISIAEYCVRGKIDELPLRNLQIIPFNLDQAKRTGEFAEKIFKQNKINKEKLSPRAIIPNDSKLFAQADLDKSITHFVTSDSRSKNTFSALKKHINPKFEIIDIERPYNDTFEILDLQ